MKISATQSIRINKTNTVANGLKKSFSNVSYMINLGKTVRENPKTSGMVAAGIFLAGALLYTASKVFGNKNKKNEQPTPVETLIKENPSKLEYIRMLGEYPKLSDGYYEFLNNSANNPDDIVKKNLLGIFELILDKYKKPDDFETNKELFKSLERNYSDNLENLCMTFFLNTKNGGSADKFLNAIKLNRMSSKETDLWTKYPDFNLNDIQAAKILPERAIQFLYEQKQSGNILSFKTDKMQDNDYYFFSLKFPKGKSLKEQFQTIVDTHEAIYGPIVLKKNSGETFTKEDVENELYDRLKKDKMLDAAYNLIKYLNPKALEEFDLSSNEVKILSEKSKKYRKLREALGRGIISMNFDSPRMQTLLEVINDKNMPKEILSNGHATIRFISRFVLKDNFNANLTNDTSKKIEVFKKELEKRFQNDVKIAKYQHKTGCAPYFYLGKNSLGEYIRITLNKDGEVHTLFESTNKIKQVYNIK